MEYIDLISEGVLKLFMSSVRYHCREEAQHERILKFSMI